MLNAEQRTELERRVRARTSFQRDAVRARIILACEEGGSASAIAQRVGVHARTVERWRVRFQRHGLAGLHDRPRPGPPPKFGPVTRLELIALACEPVMRRGGRTTWTIADLVREAVVRGLVEAISWSSYQRLLAAVDLRPHRVQGWMHSPDPPFVPRSRKSLPCICSRRQGQSCSRSTKRLACRLWSGASPIARRLPAIGDGANLNTPDTGRNRCSAPSRCIAAAWSASAGRPGRRRIWWRSWNTSPPNIPRALCT